MTTELLTQAGNMTKMQRVFLSFSPKTEAKGGQVQFSDPSTGGMFWVLNQHSYRVQQSESRAGLNMFS